MPGLTVADLMFASGLAARLPGWSPGITVLLDRRLLLSGPEGVDLLIGRRRRGYEITARAPQDLWVAKNATSWSPLTMPRPITVPRDPARAAAAVCRRLMPPARLQTWRMQIAVVETAIERAFHLAYDHRPLDAAVRGIQGTADDGPPVDGIDQDEFTSLGQELAAVERRGWVQLQKVAEYGPSVINTMEASMSPPLSPQLLDALPALGALRGALDRHAQVQLLHSGDPEWRRNSAAWPAVQLLADNREHFLDLTLFIEPQFSAPRPVAVRAPHSSAPALVALLDPWFRGRMPADPASAASLTTLQLEHTPLVIDGYGLGEDAWGRPRAGVLARNDAGRLLAIVVRVSRIDAQGDDLFELAHAVVDGVAEGLHWLDSKGVDPDAMQYRPTAELGGRQPRRNTEALPRSDARGQVRPPLPTAPTTHRR